MECHWDAALLRCGEQLPEELLFVIRQGSNEQYLQALTQAALDARYTYILLAHCEDVFAHICANLQSRGGFAASVAAFGRIIPFAPFLIPYATQLLSSEHSILEALKSESEHILYLLGLFRLLKFDHQRFRRYVKPNSLGVLLESPSRPTRYLAIRILQIYLEAADFWFEQCMQKYLGNDQPDNDISGLWDDKTIDYRFLTLWEEDLHGRVQTMIKDVQHSRALVPTEFYRRIDTTLLDRSVTLLGSVLFPRAASSQNRFPDAFIDLVCTTSVKANAQLFAMAMKTRRPLLLTGPAGVGKTLHIRNAAQALGKLDTMITLHLNEQSDAKLLLGIYTTGDNPGSFVWKPGVLTTAVQEGRWVVIEDLDRAPNEVIGAILPLIERNQLLIPSRKDTIHAAEGFRILATVRSSGKQKADMPMRLSNMLGLRQWNIVPMTMPSATELSEIARKLFPNLGPVIPQFMAVYERVQVAQYSAQPGQRQTGALRELSPCDLLKWCARASSLLKERTPFTSSEIDALFLEAVDCFVGFLPDNRLREDLVAAIAQEMRIDPQRCDYLVRDQDVQYRVEKSKIVVGRYTLPVLRTTKVHNSFSHNPHTLRMLERVTAALVNREPLLLVGETGVGKTTAVQHLADQLGKTLVPFNLSQQSEAGDLLGGFKPVNARNLIMPLKHVFDDLFAESFSATKNQEFLDLLAKQTRKSNWKSVCKLWRQALRMVEKSRSKSPSQSVGETPKKKRKIDAKYTIDHARWDKFAVQLTGVEHNFANNNEILAFDFVEGNIVKAVRNGEWILLDEINLASPDTLEAIIDLLDPASPSILLTEAGNVERIDAHPEFRVFAAMNPATDVGKKDLPPGIRSKFTELYVESPDKDIKSLQSIVRAYLTQECTVDNALPSDVSFLYRGIIGLGEQNRLVDGAGQRPHFSLRTLTRTLSFAKRIQRQCNLRRALYEGFQMSFMTLLDTESAALVQPMIEQHLFAKRTNARSELQKPLRKPEDEHDYVRAHTKSKHWIRRGDVNVEEQPKYIFTPFIERNLENLIRAASTRQFSVLIQGPTSSGKTSMIEYLAKRTGHKFVRINNHEHTDLQEYLGTYASDSSGRLQFQEGVLVRALREGHWLVLDELNLAPTDVLEALNRLLDDNREILLPETQETVRPHPNFMLFATQNPAGLYGGRKALSRAFRNRFLELHFDDIPVDELQDILHRRTMLPESRCKKIVSVYRELAVLRQENRMFEQKSFATLRDLFRWAQRDNDTIEKLASNGFMLLCERVRVPEERRILQATIERVMSFKGPKVSIDENLLYAVESDEISRYQRSTRDANVVWTKAMRRLYVLVARAIANNEPVLLVGETGCGKTTVCQMLANAFQRTLHTVNAHQNTETADLVGSQRPVRNRAAAEEQLLKLLRTSPLLTHFENNQRASTEELLTAYDKALTSTEHGHRGDSLQGQHHTDIEVLRTRRKALFEWIDGSLVQAMKGGDFFLLDEISLADDSVLERINSVLESQRTILLAEKGSLDSLVTASPGFHFFATMNPGGDYGKRELSPALRNRFTEIWVPALSDAEDILQIVQAKLVSNATVYADAIVSFANWFKRRYDTSVTRSISIRDALAWIDFVNAFSNRDVEAAIVHGAAMVYIDTLGANPAGLLSLSMHNISEERNACLAELSRLISADARAIYDCQTEIEVTEDTFGLGNFRISRASDVAKANYGFTFEPQTTKLNAMRVLRALQLMKPIMLEGSPGVGKTALITAIAGAAGKPLTRINLSDQTDLLDLFGSDSPVENGQTGMFVWRDASFLHAMKHGEWVLLDEMNLASQSVLEGLNACLDHRGEIFVPELGQSFRRHPDFRLFAAQNPHHQGGGRKGLPASFVNRFTVVYADAFGPDDLQLICRQMFPSIETAYIERAISFVSELSSEISRDRRLGSSGSPWEFNLRDISRWLSLASSSTGLLRSGAAYDFANLLFVSRFRSKVDEARVVELFRTRFRSDSPACDLFCNTSTQYLQIGIALLRRDASTATPTNMTATLMKKHQIAAIQHMMICVDQSWPVLLVGMPGSGKSMLIESLAASVGASLVTIAINAETDAMDLIGGFEQSDTQREISASIARVSGELRRLCKRTLLESELTPAISLLAALQDMMLNPSKAQRGMDRFSDLPRALASEASRMFANFEKARVVDKSRFEWVDGPLIEAMIQGKWVVLDNANLCSPSVLDRLNSLLERNGSLGVSEHSNADGTPRVLVPHPEFRVFLTVNPRLGELSRAMRNRCVELYLAELPSDSQSVCNPLHTESAIARFRAVKAVNALPDQVDEVGTALVHEHFAECDSVLIARFQRQLHSGLFAASQNAPRDLGLPAWTQMPLFQAEDPSLNTFYQEMSKELQLQGPADFARSQTMHPLNNQPLAQLSENAFNEALSLASRHDLGVLLYLTRQKFQLLKSDRKFTEQLTRFMRLTKRQRNYQGPVEALGSILDAIGAWLFQAVKCDMTKEAKWWISAVLSFVEVASQSLQSSSIGHPTLNAISVAGNAFLAPSTQSDPDPLSSFCRTTISSIGAPSIGAAGQISAALWHALQPPTSTNFEELQALLGFEKAVEEFDLAARMYHLPIQEVIDLRLSIQQSYGLRTSSSLDFNQLAAAMQSLLPQWPNDEQIEPAGISAPWFSPVFENLCQHFALMSLRTSCLAPEESGKLEVLALRNTLDGMNQYRADGSLPTWKKLRLLRLSTNIHLNDARATGQGHYSREDVGQDILQSLVSPHEVSLDDLDVFQVEVKVLSQILASKIHLIKLDNLDSLDDCLREFTRDILGELSLSTDRTIGDLAARIVCRLHGDQSGSAAEQPFAKQALLEHRSSSSLARFLEIEEYLREACTSPRRCMRASSAWLAFGLACLDFFIPAQPLDPVEVAQLHKEFHQRQQAHLRHVSQVLEAFNQAWTGNSISLRSRLLDEQINSLGPSPPAVNICRPPSSALSQLWTEFEALSRILEPVRQHAATEVHQKILGDEVWANVLVVQRRLQKHYRAYEDLSAPVIGLIECLNISQKLAKRALQEEVAESALLAPAVITPLVKARLSNWLSDDHFVNVLHGCQSRAERLYWLEVVAVRAEITATPLATSKLCDEVNSVFQSFYETWRDELSRDQKLAAAKSSLYKYHGDNDDQTDATEEELAELFPTYEGHDAVDTMTNPPNQNARTLGSRMAALYHRIHTKSIAKPDILNDTLLQYSLVASSDLTTKCEYLFPTLLCALKQRSGILNGEVFDSGRTNIYLDPDIEQCKALLVLLTKISKHFKTLHEAWPEHATPIDALRACHEIRKLPHSAPLISFMPYVERLHAIVNEWQKVASSEFSAQGVLDETTDLIVRWRQLELSTWAGLFNQEDKHCKESAAAWWYIAYETIIRATEDFDDAVMETRQQFAQAVVETVSDFLAQCGIGEFTARLAMLRDFEADLHIRSSCGDTVNAVHEALSGLVSYYAYFEDTVGSHLKQKRTELEKQIKDVIQLASWKDRNIETLRNSAKVSHRKLFRIVRKYRKMLGEPVQPLLQAELPRMREQDFTKLKMTDVSVDTENVGGRPALGIEELPIWNAFPPHMLKVFSSACGNIQDIPDIDDTFQGPQQISAWLQELEDEAKELRKSTPVVATQENKALVQHLKTQKRRLLAEVLRDTRVMGFQVNLSDHITSRQNSLFAVLARTCALSSDRHEVDAANYQFYRSLHTMSALHDSSLKFSEDLTAAEISRAKSLLESMLQTSLEQHNLLGQQLIPINSLMASLTQIESLSTSQDPWPDDLDERSLNELDFELSSVLSVLQASAHCVEIQAKFSGTNYEKILSSLVTKIETLHKLNSDLKSQGQMPPGIGNAATRSLQNRFVSAMQEIHDQVAQAGESFPELEPTLSCSFNWTLPFTHGTDKPIHIVQSESWMHQLVRVSELVHDAIASASALGGSRIPKPLSKSWLLEEQGRVARFGEALQCNVVSTQLFALVRDLSGFRPDLKTSMIDVALICARLRPLLQLYVKAVRQLFSAGCRLHEATCRLMHHLATQFMQLASNGFCSPSEKTQQNEQSREMESGTGLGDGEGAEDISKDVQDDEDLSELAQGSKQDKEDDEAIENEKDAVDMADEDFEGEFGEDGSEAGSEDEGEDPRSQDEIEEETGHVDNSEESATDLKTWESDKAEKQDKEADTGKGSKSEEIAAPDDMGREGDGQEDKFSDPGQEPDDGADIESEVPPDMDKADAHMEEQQNLELPEDMAMDGENLEFSDVSDTGSEMEEPEGTEDVRDEAVADDADSETNSKEDGGEIGVESAEATATEDIEQPEPEPQPENEDLAMMDRPDSTEAEITDALNSANTGQGEDRDERDSDEVPSAAQDMGDEKDAVQSTSQPGTAGGDEQSEKNASQGEGNVEDDRQVLPFKQLGDILKKWYDQHKEIAAAQEAQEASKDQPEATDVNENQFEHLPEDLDSDQQALGTASAEQSRSLDNSNAINTENDEKDQPPSDRTDEQKHESENEEVDVSDSDAIQDPTVQQSASANAMVGTPKDADMQDLDANALDLAVDEMDDMDDQMTNTHLFKDENASTMSIDEARKLWAEHESRTRNMAIVLTEHLRLILNPTQATKMRGDFRTGKRLNIKKIIPYIASSYRRDKIWMRRSIPSKRNYQVMLAIDDSESMTERDSRNLAFDTLALVAKSMSMLEVGDLSVVGFGGNTNVAHEFGLPFTSEAGAEIYQQFSFSQSKTDVRRLLERSIEIFREARLRATGSASSLWQLQLIISDGDCEDHASIRRLVRQAQEERIMVVFIIVDSAATSKDKNKQSILDLKRAEFVKDANGDADVRWTKYLDTFPFRYYLIVRDVLELPGVLAGALRQWFEEVVEAST